MKSSITEDIQENKDTEVSVVECKCNTCVISNKLIMKYINK